MKRKNISTFILFAIGIMLTACNKELNVYPTTSEVDGNVIHDTKGAQTVLNGVYYRFVAGGADYNNVPTIKWTDINEVVPSELAGTLQPPYDDQISTFTMTPLTGRIDYIWSYGYALVNAANGFLKNVEPVTSIPTNTKNQMLGEARFLRAFANAELLLYYGQYADPSSPYGIILRDEFVTPDNIVQGRATVAQCYTSILADLDFAISNLPAQNTQIFYANASAAKLLKARVLINRGASGDYATVISLTNDIITNGPFALDPSQKNLFLSEGFTSKEVILGANPFPTQTYKWSQYQYYGQFYASPALVTLLTNDPRNQWVYKPDQSGTIYGNAFGGINEVTKYYPGNVNPAAFTAVAENCYPFRLTEAYLLEAEAITLSGGDLSQAKTLLKTVEATAGITNYSDVDATTTAADLQLLIVKEEMKNFYCENGADWFALRRLPFATIQTLQPALKSAARLILPIPQVEINANSKCVQNPGY